MRRRLQFAISHKTSRRFAIRPGEQNSPLHPPSHCHHYLLHLSLIKHQEAKKTDAGFLQMQCDASIEASRLTARLAWWFSSWSSWQRWRWCWKRQWWSMMIKLQLDEETLRQILTKVFPSGGGPFIITAQCALCTVSFPRNRTRWDMTSHFTIVISLNIFFSQLVRLRGKHSFEGFCELQTLNLWFSLNYTPVSTTEQQYIPLCQLRGHKYPPVSTTGL